MEEEYDLIQEFRKARQAAEEEAFNRQIEAVMAISLAEASQREKIEQQAAIDAIRRQESGDDDLEAFKQQVDEKRKARMDAQERYEQKVMEAVMKASLVEFTERSKIEKKMSVESMQLDQSMEEKQSEIEEMKEAAHRSKTMAVQNVLDLKKKAFDAKVQAQSAANEFRKKEEERQEKLIEMDELEKVRQQQALLAAAKQRTEEAATKRLEAEKRAQEALERAKELREKAINAARYVRQVSRTAIESTIGQEEAVRTVSYEHQMSIIHGETEEVAHLRMEKERIAHEKLENAKELQEKAHYAINHLHEPTTSV
ncbi:hypothetical protein THRCLA_22868 [Thraustotheca clavata]|uniref:Uncharacterized protein n=1 Tax=Thraustotheca clavata TaxID=74557 RepID=A0A1V9YRZ8_9STRA|nr:hypothetical protein THRCLA_22868 [Thraustotheca clavata]